MAEVSELGEGPEETLPASSLLGYLAHLTSAVQFVTNMVRCTEKRNEACDPDSPLPVSVCVCVSQSEDTLRENCGYVHYCQGAVL